MIIAGWYGKLASLGDFASRRLSPAFVARWDAWLQMAISASRASLGGAWLDAYLTGPVWRFIEWPRSATEPLHAGVLMASVDRVGRYFPLCVAAPLPSSPADDEEWRSLAAWCDQVETAALATLDTGYGADQFDDALRALPVPAPRRTSAPLAALLLERLRGAVGQGAPEAVQPDALAPLLGQAAALSLAHSVAGASLWWTRGPERATLLACPALPDGACFTAMLQPERHGLPDGR